ncbi:spermidine synthase [Spirochaetota bacterium]|nr:spermidine synthase [Spirochaetota bacterium]
MKNIVSEQLSPSYGFFYTFKERLHHERTAYQNLELVATEEFGNVMLLDGFTQVGERKHFQYHELIADAPLLAHPCPEKVLIIGGGDGGVTHHVLRHPSVKHVTQVELDERVTQCALKFMPLVSKGALSDSKLQLIFADGKEFVSETTDRYDVIIMDLTDPIGAAAELYTQGFLTRLKAKLRDDTSYVSLHTTSPIVVTKLFAVIINTLRATFPEVMTFYNYIQMYGTLWSVSVAGTGTMLKTLDTSTISKRIAERKLHSLLLLLTGATYHSLQIEPPFIKQLLAERVPIAKTVAELALE